MSKRNYITKEMEDIILDNLDEIIDCKLDLDDEIINLSKSTNNNIIDKLNKLEIRELKKELEVYNMVMTMLGISEVEENECN